jgi:hypothetical protein
MGRPLPKYATSQARMDIPRISIGTQDTLSLQGLLYWECSSLCASEDRSRGDLFLTRGRFALAGPTPKIFVKPVDSAHQKRKIWAGVVRAYSSRNQTNPSDKLVALSGVARGFGRAAGMGDSDYLADYGASSCH